MNRKRDGSNLPMDTAIQTAASPSDAAEAEMEAIMAAYEQPLLRYAASLLPNPHAAQDAVQHAFIQLCSYGFPLPFDPPALRTWLYRTTRNAALDLLRAEKRRRELHERAARETPPSSSPPPNADPQDPRWEKLNSALASLSEPEREVLLLRLQENLSYTEIAAITHRPVGTIGRLLHEAVQKLSHLVKHESREDSP